MKTAEVKQRIKLWVTPALLRAWADQMEKDWPNRHCGESVVWADFIVSDEVDLAICFDQDEMEREDRRRFK